MLNNLNLATEVAKAVANYLAKNEYVNAYQKTADAADSAPATPLNIEETADKKEAFKAEVKNAVAEVKAQGKDATTKPSLDVHLNGATARLSTKESFPSVVEVVADFYLRVSYALGADWKAHGLHCDPHVKGERVWSAEWVHPIFACRVEMSAQDKSPIKLSVKAGS